MFIGAADRHLETLIRIEEAALQRLNDLMSRDFVEEAKPRQSAPNAELFVELNQEKRLTMELQETLARLQEQSSSRDSQNMELQLQVVSLASQLSEQNTEISKLQDALQKLRQDRLQSPTLVAPPAVAKEGANDAVVGILRNRIKFLEAENEKQRNLLNR